MPESTTLLYSVRARSARFIPYADYEIQISMFGHGCILVNTSKSVLSLNFCTIS
jgi:hypothetical protein